MSGFSLFAGCGKVTDFRKLLEQVYRTREHDHGTILAANIPCTTFTPADRAFIGRVLCDRPGRDSEPGTLFDTNEFSPIRDRVLNVSAHVAY
jgi:hypothetical protein